MISESQNGRGTTCENDLWPNVLELEWGILRMCVSAEEQRSLEGVYRCRSSERYCGPVPVSTWKQSMDILYCIHALIGSQCNNWRMGWTWSWLDMDKFSCPTDKSYSCVLNFLQSVNEKLWTASKCAVEVVQVGQDESTVESLSHMSSE